GQISLAVSGPRRTCRAIGTVLTGVTVVPIATDIPTRSSVAARATISKSSAPTLPWSAASLLVDARDDATSTNRAAGELRDNALCHVRRDFDERVVLADVDLSDLGARNLRLVRDRT